MIVLICAERGVTNIRLQRDIVCLKPVVAYKAVTRTELQENENYTVELTSKHTVRRRSRYENARRGRLMQSSEPRERRGSGGRL